MSNIITIGNLTWDACERCARNDEEDGCEMINEIELSIIDDDVACSEFMEVEG